MGGVTTEAAAMRIVNLAQTMMTKQISGVRVKESLERRQWLRQNDDKEKSLK